MFRIRRDKHFRINTSNSAINGEVQGICGKRAFETQSDQTGGFVLQTLKTHRTLQKPIRQTQHA